MLDQDPDQKNFIKQLMYLISLSLMPLWDSLSMGLATLTTPVVGSIKQYTYLISLSLMSLWDSLSMGLATLTIPVVGSTSNSTPTGSHCH